MKTTLLASAAAVALCTAAQAEQLTVFGPWLGPDQENVEAVLSVFAEQSGHDVRYVGSDSFEQQIMIDAEAGSAPNVAVFPQPGLAADMAARGFLTPLPEGTADWVRENYAAGQSWVDLGTYAGADGTDNLYGFFYKVDVKSLVWYSPENFEDAGYEVPDHHGRTQGADRPDRRRWRHALVHRPGFGRRDRLAGDRLGRGHDAAHPDPGRL